jgi:hypothetical protein
MALASGGARTTACGGAGKEAAGVASGVCVLTPMKAAASAAIATATTARVGMKDARSALRFELGSAADAPSACALGSGDMGLISFGTVVARLTRGHP